MALTKKVQFQRLIRNLQTAVYEHQTAPDIIIGAALARWCSSSFPGLPRSGLPAPATLRRHPAVAAFVDFIKEGDLMEALYWLSSAYAQLVGGECRKKLAMFFTPPALSKRLLDNLSETAVDFSRGTFCDPACGGAAFLAPIAIRMRNALRARRATPRQILGHVEGHLFGIDKDRTLCQLSRHFLRMALYDEIQATGTLPDFRIFVGDSLRQAPDLVDPVDIVVCNPPFRKMSAAEVSECFSDFADIIEAQPNIYALFIALCVKLLAPEGTCALVTPTSFLSGQYFSKLRTFLMNKTKLLNIGVVSDRLGVFIDVEQETALTLLRQEENSHKQATIAGVSLVSKAGDHVPIGQCSLPNSGSAWPIPRTEKDVALLYCAAQSKVRLSDYGYAVRIGAYVWNRDGRPTYRSAKSAARAKGRSAVPLLWSSDIATDGTLCFDGLPKANQEPSFVNLGSKAHRSIIRRPSVLLQRVTSNTQRKRLVAAAVPNSLLNTYGGFVGENHTVILEQVVEAAALPPEKLAQLLSTPTVDRYFRCISGATNVSAFELRQLPLPDPAILKTYLAQGCDMAEAARRAFEGGGTACPCNHRARRRLPSSRHGHET